MRRLVVLSLVSACAHPAFGPSSDERLEQAVNDSRQGAASEDAVAQELAKRSCSGDRKRLGEAEQEDRPDADRLAAFVKLFGEITQRQTELDKIIKENPGAEFSG